MVRWAKREGLLGIRKSTDNWKTSRVFAPLFGEAGMRIARRLGENTDTGTPDVRLELFWARMPDFISGKCDAKRSKDDLEAWKRKIQAS